MKYAENRLYSEKEKVDAVIQLGIVEYAPQWLNPETRRAIEKYYPGLAIKHAYNGSHSLTKFAFNEYGPTQNDGPQILSQRLAAVAVAPAVQIAVPAGELFSSEAFAEVMGYLGLTVTGIGIVLSSVLTGDSIQKVESAKNKICVSGECAQVKINNEVINKDGIALSDPTNGNNKQFCNLVNQSTITHPPTTTSAPKGRFRFDKKCTYRCADGLIGTVDDTYSLSKECISIVPRSQLGFGPL